MKMRFLESRSTHLLSVLLWALLCCFCVQVRSAPANDHASQAEVISGTNTELFGTLIGATAEASERSHNGYRARKSVWYSWTAPFGGEARVVLTPDWTAGPMHIVIYTGTPFTTLRRALAEEYRVGTQRTFMFPAVAGVRYLIMVDEEDINSGGAFKLGLDVRSTRLTFIKPVTLNNWYAPAIIDFEITMESGAQLRYLDLYDGNTFLQRFLAPPFVYRLTNQFAGVRSISARALDVDGVQYNSVTNHIEVRNPNENFKDALLIPPNGGSAKMKAVAINGSREAGEPLHGLRARDALWWRWTPRVTGMCKIWVSEWASIYSVSLYTGTAVNDLKPVSGESIKNGLSFLAVAGTPYHIAFTVLHNTGFTAPGAFEFQSFQLSLETDSALEPAVGKAPIPLRVNSVSGFDSFSTVEVYSRQEGSPPNFIGTVRKANPVVWWSPSTEGAHSVWAVGKSAEGDALSDAMNLVVGVRNDDFANARPLPRLSPYFWMATPNFLGATAESGEPQHSGLPAVRSIWYTWTAPEDGHVALRFIRPYVTSPFRSSVYTGEELQTLKRVDEGATWIENSSILDVEFDATRGVTYRIVVDLGDKPAYPGATADIFLDWTPVRSGELEVRYVASDWPHYFLDIRSPDDGLHMIQALFPEEAWIDWQPVTVSNGRAEFRPSTFLPVNASNVWFRVRKMEAPASP